MRSETEIPEGGVFDRGWAEEKFPALIGFPKAYRLRFPAWRRIGPTRSVTDAANSLSFLHLHLSSDQLKRVQFGSFVLAHHFKTCSLDMCLGYQNF